MSAEAASNLEMFEPDTQRRAFDLGCTVLRGLGGIRLELTRAGTEKLAEDAAFGQIISGLATSMQHSKQTSGKLAVTRLVPADTLRVSYPDADYSHMFALSSIYRPHAAPTLAIKSYDYCPPEAAPQFYFMNWLQVALENSTTNGTSLAVQAPRQFALISSTESKQSAALMEFMPDQSLYSQGAAQYKELGTPRVHALQKAIRMMIRQDLRKKLGLKAFGINDLHTNNILMSGHELPQTKEDAFQRTYTVIDQLNIPFVSLKRRNHRS